MDSNEIYEGEVLENEDYEIETEENESTGSGAAVVVGGLIALGIGVGVAVTKITEKIKAKREAKKLEAGEEDTPKPKLKDRVKSVLHSKKPDVQETEDEK